MRRFSYEFIKSYFFKKGCELLADDYKNSHQALLYRCKCGKILSTRFASFKRGGFCKECGYKSGAAKQRHEYKFIKKYFSKNNCTLLSKRYERMSQKLKYICSCGNVGGISFGKFMAGQRCSICAKNKKLTYSDVNKTFTQYGCELLSKAYANANQRLLYICSCGGKALITFSKFKSGQRCRQCKNKKISTSNSVPRPERRGQNHPNWTGNGKENEQQRRHFEYKLWRKSVFQRDVFTCQLCKEQKTYLQAHHLNSFADNVDLRISLDNGITLCGDCHENFHHQYGNGRNTATQFYEFIKENKKE